MARRWSLILLADTPLRDHAWKPETLTRITEQIHETGHSRRWYLTNS
jgi:hypothetical protein